MKEKQNRDFKGVWIPKAIWLNPELSITEKCLLVEIDSLDNDDAKGCFASNEYLAGFIGLSAGRVANMVSDLRKRGFVTQVFFDGRNRGLRVPILHENVNNLHENVKAAVTKSLKLPSQKREHSNIDNNTTDIESTPAEFLVTTIALETIPTVECEVPRPAARPTSKISELQKNINAHSEAAEHFLRLLQAKGHSLNGAEKYAAAYFLNEQRKGRWVSLLIPVGAGAEHQWLGEHGPGIIQWAQRQPQFERNNGTQPTAPTIATNMRLSNPENAPR